MTIQQYLQGLAEPITQADMARLTGLGESYISRILSGDRPVPPVIHSYRKIAAALGISLDELLDMLEAHES